LDRGAIHYNQHEPQEIVMNNRPTVVIGAGIMGVSAARELVKRNVSVILIEQFRLGHDRGSSHGESRIIRYSYSDPLYALLMRESFAAWSQLESDVGKALYLRTGGLSFGPTTSDYVARIAGNLRDIMIPSRMLSATEANRIYPGLSIPNDFEIAFEPTAGVVLADDAISLSVQYCREATPSRFQLRENFPVERIELESNYPVIFGPNGEQFEAERVIVAAGPWLTKLLQPTSFTETRQITTTRQTFYYLKPQPLEHFSIGKWPVLIHKGTSDDELFYSLPAINGRGIKLAQHGGSLCDADSVSRQITTVDFQPVQKFIQRYVKAWADSPIAEFATCIYTMTPDEHFRLGPLSQNPRVILASPCSGHGFKFGPLIGKILAELSTQGSSDLLPEVWNPLSAPQDYRSSL